MFEIEKGVPRVRKKCSGRAEKYPWAKMAVGDSFFVPNMGMEAAKKQAVISSCAGAAGRRYGRKFSTSQLDGGIRVWRIE